MSSLRLPLALAALAACNFPRPADVGDDHPPIDASTSADSNISVDASSIDAAIDAPEQPGTVVHVSPFGDDANDGLTKPVKTLRHAIGIAADDVKITTIALASGRYSSATGETFAYAVPPNVTIAGPSDSVAALVGTKAEAGISLDSGGLQDINLEDFTTAITVTGMATLKNVHILTSVTAVQAETAAKVTANGLDIVGSAGACTMGIVLHGSAQLTATTLTSRNLGTTLTANDQSTVSIGEASISGDRSCSQSLGLIMVTSSASFSIRNSLLDGGPNHGILLNPRSSLFQATLSTTIIKNMRLDGLGGGAPAGGSMSFQMNGGEISNNGNAGAELSDGTWAFTNVTIQHNSGVAIYLQGATLVMRGCMVTDNRSGIDVFDNAVADLGTATDPGNNVFHGTTSVGLTLDGSFGARLINAVGNTWNPGKQGADTNGRYPTPPSVVFAPVNFADGNNYTLLGSWSLLR